GVEVVPDADPVEAERFDALPHRCELAQARVLQSGVHAEADAHDALPILDATSAAINRTWSWSARSSTCRYTVSGPASPDAPMRSTISLGSPPRLFARRLAGSCPIADARRASSASSDAQHTVCATVMRSVAGSRPAASHAARTRCTAPPNSSTGANGRLNSLAYCAASR